MPFKKHEINDFRAILFLVLATLPLVAPTNINCHGKPFYCMNSTHFMICVDIGGGYSSTIDNFIIPCPPTTVCRQNNRFECEFPPATPSTSTIEVIEASTRSFVIESTTTGKQNVFTTDLPAQTTATPIYNIVTPMILNTDNSAQVFEQQTNVSPMLNIEATESVTAKTDLTLRNMDTFTSTAKTTKYTNMVDVQLTSPTPKENHRAVDAINNITTVETYTSGKESNATHIKNIPTDIIKPEMTTESAAFITYKQKLNNNGINNNTKNLSPITPYSQNFSNTTQETATLGNELLTTNVVTETLLFPISLSTANTETAIISTNNQINKDFKDIGSKVQGNSTLNLINTVKIPNPAIEQILTGPKSSTSLVVDIGGTSSNQTTPSDSIDSQVLSMTTVTENYLTSIRSVINASSTNNLLVSDASTATLDITVENLHNNDTVKITRGSTIQAKLNTGTEGSLSSHQGTDNIVDGHLIGITTEKIPWKSVDSQNIAKNILQETATTNAFNEPLTTNMVTLAIADAANTSTDFHINKDLKGVNNTVQGNSIVDILNTVKPTSLVTEPTLAGLQSSTSSVLDIGLVPTQSNSPISTDSPMFSINTVGEKYTTSVDSGTNVGSPNITIASNSSTLDVTHEKLHSKDTFKTTEALTKEQNLYVGTENNWSAQHLTDNIKDGHLIGMTTQQIPSKPVDSQNISNNILQETAITSSNTNAFTELFITNMMTVTTADASNTTTDFRINKDLKGVNNTVQGNSTVDILNTVKPKILVTEPTLAGLQSSTSSVLDIGLVPTQSNSPISTDSPMFSINTVGEKYTTDVGSSNITIVSYSPSSTLNLTTEKLHSHDESKTTQAPRQQSKLNNGTEGSLYSDYTTDNIMGGNLIGITNEKITPKPVDGQNVSNNTLQETATTSSNTNAYNGPLTSNMVTIAIAEGSSTVDILNTVKPISTVTKPTPTGSQSSTLSVVGMGSISIKSKSTTSADTTESPMLLSSTMVELYPTLINFDINASSNYNTVTNKIPLLSTDESITISTNYNISNTTQAGEINTRTKQADIATERGLMTHSTTNNIGSLTNNTTLENISTLSIDRPIISSTLLDVVTTSSYANTFIGKNNTNLVTTTADSVTRSTNTMGTQSWNETVATNQERSTFNITDTVISTSPLTPLMTEYVETSISTVRDEGAISEKSTVFPIGTDFPTSLNTIVENSFNFSENKSPLATTDAITGVFNNNTLLKTTQEHTKTLDIGTGTDFITNSQSNHTYQTTIVTDSVRQNSSNKLQDIVTSTTSYTNTFDGHITTHLTTIATAATVKKTTDINVSQTWNGAVTAIQEGSTFHISDNLIPINLESEPIPTGNTADATTNIPSTFYSNSGSTILLPNIVPDKPSNSIIYDMDINVNNYTAISEPSTAGNITNNRLNNNTIEDTTQASTKQHDIATEMQIISNALQGTVTTIALNTDASLTKNMVTESHTHKTNSSTDIPTNQNVKSVVKKDRESSTSNISDSVKTSILVTDQIPSNGSANSLAEESTNKNQWTTSDASTDSILLSVSPVTEYPTTLHLNISANVTNTTNTSNILLEMLDVNGGKLSNNETSNITQAATKYPEPNGGSEKSLSTDMSKPENLSLNQNVSNKKQDTTTVTPSSSNVFIDSDTVNMVTVIDIVNRYTDIQETQTRDTAITTILENSTLNRLDSVQSTTTAIPIEKPVTVYSTTLSMTAVAENYSISGHFDMSENVTNNDVISKEFSTISDVTNGNIKTNNIFKTTQTHVTIPGVSTESSMSSYNTTDITGSNTIYINPKDIFTAHADKQNYSHIVLPAIATTSFHSDNLNETLTKKMVAEEIIDTENRSTDTVVNQNWDGNLTTTQDSSYTLQTASPMTVVSLTGNSQTSTSAEETKYFMSTLSMSSSTEKYLISNDFGINTNITNNTLTELRTSYSIDEKSNTTSKTTQSNTKLADVGTESSITSSTNSDNIIWTLKNRTSTTQSFTDLTNTMPNQVSTSNGLETSITDDILFSSQNHTENTIINSGSKTINGQTTPMTFKAHNLTSTVLVSSVEANSSFHFIENSTPKQTNDGATTEFDNTKKAEESTYTKTEVTSTASLTNPLDVLLNKTTNNQQYVMTSTSETESSFKTQESNNNSGLTTPITLSTNYINTKPEFSIEVTSTSQQHKMNSETNNVDETNVSSVHYITKQNIASITTPATDQVLTTGSLSTEGRIQLIKATTQIINSSFYIGTPDFDGLVPINHSYLNTTETISPKQINIENSANSFSGINVNISPEISKQSDPAVNVLSTTKYPKHTSEVLGKIHSPKYSSNINSYLSPVTENQLTILTSSLSGQTTEVYSGVGNVATNSASLNDISDHSKNQTHNNSIDTSKGKNHMNHNHDISTIPENNSNRTFNKRNQTEIPAVLHNVHKASSFTPSKPEYYNVDNGNNNIVRSFNCQYHRRGRYADNDDCRKFYICIGYHQPILGTCPENTVFSEINKQCTKNLSHCVRNNQFQCTSEGRFGDYLKYSVYYICVKNAANAFVKFKLQCQNGYYLNKADVRCTRNTEGTSESKSIASDSSKSSNRDHSITKPKSQESEESIGSNERFTCNEEGKFADPNDCRRYYVCSKRNKSGFRLKKKTCERDEVFHKDKKKCIAAESNEC